MATEAVQSNSTQTGDPRAARLAILAAARRVHHRDGAGAVSIACVAMEAGIAPEIVSAHFQNPQEILLALAADDLSALARTIHDKDGHDEGKDGSAKPAAPVKAETPAQPPVSLRKRAVLPAPLEQVMKDVAPDQGKEVITGAMARIERRIQVMEKAFTDIADRHEKSVRDSGGAFASVEESIGAVLTRMDSAEKHNVDVMGNFRSALSTVAIRLDALEKSKSGASISGNEGMAGPEYLRAPSGMPGTAEGIAAGDKRDIASSPPLESHVAEARQEPARGDRAAKPDTRENYLTTARRSALAAAGNESKMKTSVDPAHGRRGNRAWFLIFACLAPAAILGTAFVVLNRNAVTAEPGQMSQPGAPPSVTALLDGVPPQDESPAVTAAEVIVAPPADPIPWPMPSKLRSAGSLATLTQEAEAGDVQSMRDAGLKYLSGDGVDVNETQAARWLMRAAYKGEAVAEYWLATLYARGYGVPADAFQASHWYEAAAKQGNRRAMHSLAVANFQGLGVEKNHEEAARWFKASSEIGLVDSQFNLAVLYERGSGVPQSLTEAYKWYAVAATQGDKEADNRLAVLASQMKPADLAQARSAAAAFKPQPMNETANLTTGG